MSGTIVPLAFARAGDATYNRSGRPYQLHQLLDSPVPNFHMRHNADVAAQLDRIYAHIEAGILSKPALFHDALRKPYFRGSERMVSPIIHWSAGETWKVMHLVTDARLTEIAAAYHVLAVSSVDMMISQTRTQDTLLKAIGGRLGERMGEAYPLIHQHRMNRLFVVHFCLCVAETGEAAG